MKQNLSIIRGTTQSINIFIKTVDGLDYEIEENEIIRFGVKKRYNNPNAEYLIEKEMTKKDQCEDGSYIFVISPADTMSLPFGTYYYDIGVQSGEDYFNIVECSEFNVKYNITSLEE